MNVKYTERHDRLNLAVKDGDRSLTSSMSRSRESASGRGITHELMGGGNGEGK